MIELRYATAGQEITLGYFLDSIDQDTEEILLAIANTDIKLWKWGATTLANIGSGSFVLVYGRIAGLDNLIKNYGWN